MTTDEILSAFIDGELPPEEMKEVRREIEKSAALAERVEALKSADRAVARAYSAIDDEPMPQSVLDLLARHKEAGGAGGSNVVSFPSRLVAGGGRYWQAALAASLALAAGIGLGLQMSPGAQTGRGDILIAGAIEKTNPLYSALETTLSAETVRIDGDSGAAFTPVLSFRSPAGDYCREIALTAGERANRAVACRHDDEWVIEFAVAAAPLAQDGETYSTASSGLSTAFDAFVEDLISGGPLAPEEEAALIEAGWKADG